MVIEIDALQYFLLTTVQGVIILGAVGSMLGGVIIYALKKSISYAKSKIQDISPAARITYPLVRSVLSARKLRQAHIKDHEAFDYPLFVVRKLIFMALDFISFICIATLTAGTSIVYGIDQPITLSILISLSILSFWSALKTGIYATTLTKGAANINSDKINIEIPKKYSESLQKSTKEKA